MREMGFGADLEVWDTAEANRRLGSSPGTFHGCIRYPKVMRACDGVETSA